jgi:hypothetical protein
MTEQPKVPDGDGNAVTEAAEKIVEVVFDDHYGLALLAFVAGAILIAGIVYYMGTRTVETESENDAAD